MTGSMTLYFYPLHICFRCDFCYALCEVEKFLCGRYGSWYISAVKDRLYCDEKMSERRVSAQKCMHICVDTCEWDTFIVLFFIGIYSNTSTCTVVDTYGRR